MQAAAVELAKVRHKNIVNVLAAELINEDLFVVLEYMSEGNHFKINGIGNLVDVYKEEQDDLPAANIINEQFGLPETIVRVYSRHVLHALKALH